MYREELYKSTVDIILDAYSEKKLEHGNPCGCFIGNIVAKRYNTKPFKGYPSMNLPYSPDWWELVNMTNSQNKTKEWYWDSSCNVEEGKKQIEAIGYTIEEVIELEKAFENAYDCFDEKYDEDGKLIPPPQYEGMKAALIKLAEIHNTPPTESIERLDKIQELVYN